MEETIEQMSMGKCPEKPIRAQMPSMREKGVNKWFEAYKELERLGIFGKFISREDASEASIQMDPQILKDITFGDK